MTDTLTLPTPRSLRLPQPRTLHVTQGHVWITIEGDAADHLLAPGQTLPLPARRHVVIEALDGRACCQLASTACSAPPRWRTWLPSSASAPSTNQRTACG
ncbi:MAG: DUF2917 domain-containing protein [Proteobacteria bacterium]|nr:DUF2917 domain-containing protein [Pseudomonadota bacterium]